MILPFLGHCLVSTYKDNQSCIRYHRHCKHIILFIFIRPELQYNFIAVTIFKVFHRGCLEDSCRLREQATQSC